jgi:hypothetical protein
VDHGRTGPSSDAPGATATTPGGGGRCAARRAPDATPAGESLGHAGASTAAAGLARRQTALRRGARQTCLEGLHRHRPGPPDGQQRQRPPRQRAMTRPPRPAADCVVIQADCPRGGLNAPRKGPAAARHPPAGVPRGGLRGQDHRGGHRRGSAQTAPHQPPAAPGGLQGGARGRQRHASPRGPVAPAPALRRVQPARGTAARSVLTGRGCPLPQPSAWPETASTQAGGRASSPSRRRRSWPYTPSPVTPLAGTPASRARASR